ncbi:MAG: type II secretion system major pseudopilin GspG [Sedimentisphaerales bacterium]|nr:type II secretion system major pseudopilin GspG [Sedimentisphaerales bacterium]MBN2843915.1 type II secretion system major pseudopilin GspG [Sedimentisphaerales bacterium]
MKKNKGFTIIEILVVIVLISLLAVIMLPRFISQAESARQKLVKPRMALLEQSLTAFWTDCGRFPNQTEGLAALLKEPSGLTGKWKGPYAREDILLDPWGNPFEYIIPGKDNINSYDLISRGRDGKPSGTGDDADVFNK